MDEIAIAVRRAGAARWFPLLGAAFIEAHKAPVPEPVEEPMPGEHPVPQEDPVPSPNPETQDGEPRA